MPSSTARTARLRSAAWAAAGHDHVSSSAMPAAYDTITPFAYRGDMCSRRAARLRLPVALHEHTTEDLARQRLWNLVDELDGAELLVGRHPLGHVVHDLLGPQLGRCEQSSLWH